MIKLCIIAGARPNFMKIAPIVHEIRKHNASTASLLNYLIVHTGQHYDERMSRIFFDNLELPPPDIDLGVGSASHAIQTAEIMKRFESVCTQEKPTHIIVVGDVNSTIACALVGSKLGIKIVHVEAGLRSFDRTMPEEINRVLTDAISDTLFTTEESANQNLHHEGIVDEKIHFVGNVMIDTLLKHKRKAEQSDILFRLGLKGSQVNSPRGIRGEISEQSVISYAILTLHRPSNVDNKLILQRILEALVNISREIPIIFPIHPRTLKRIEEFGFREYFLASPTGFSPPFSAKGGRIWIVEPLGYLDFLQLMSHSKLILTDSGGIQEESTILGIPCVTMRENTERPITVQCGTNRLVGTSSDKIISASQDALNGESNSVSVPPLWDGRAAERIKTILLSECY